MPQRKRFESCGFSTVQPDEGTLIECAAENLNLVRDIVRGERLLQSSDRMRVVFSAIFNHMEPAREFVKYGFVQFDLFHFRPTTGFVEERSGAKYEIFQVPLLGSGGYEYAYVVIDHVLSRQDEDDDIIIGFYRLRGVSAPMPIATPEYNWCNADYNWLFWNDAPTDFNVGAGVVH